MSSKPTARSNSKTNTSNPVSLPSPEASAVNLSSADPTSDPSSSNPAAIEGDAVPPPEPERKALNLMFAKSRPGSSGLIPRPIDPSPVRVSHTVSIAGTRPVMADPRQSPDVLRQAPKIMNRPIAPNQTEDSNRILEYLD